MTTVVAKMITTLVSSADKHGFKSVISIFCCSVSVGNIDLAINCNNAVICVSDLIIISLSGMNEETEQTETKSRRTVS